MLLEKILVFADFQKNSFRKLYGLSKSAKKFIDIRRFQPQNDVTR